MKKVSFTRLLIRTITYGFATLVGIIAFAFSFVLQEKFLFWFGIFAFFACGYIFKLCVSYLIDKEYTTPVKDYVKGFDENKKKLSGTSKMIVYGFWFMVSLPFIFYALYFLLGFLGYVD